MSKAPHLPLVGALVLAAAGLVAVASLGPLTGGPVDYHVSETLRNQTIGLDAASLLVVVPVAVVAAVLTLRAHVAGPVLARPAGEGRPRVPSRAARGPLLGAASRPRAPTTDAQTVAERGEALSGAPPRRPPSV
jgi:hypothetical protein